MPLSGKSKEQILTLESRIWDHCLNYYDKSIHTFSVPHVKFNPKTIDTFVILQHALPVRKEIATIELRLPPLWGSNTAYASKEKVLPTICSFDVPRSQVQDESFSVEIIEIGTLYSVNRMQALRFISPRRRISTNLPA